jgi:predicted helicase
VTALLQLLQNFRNAAQSEREKGTYFEELTVQYLRHEAAYAALYSDVWSYAAWAKQNGLDGKDAGIDLVAKTRGAGDLHAIQCKFYDEDYHLQKKDIDSFFTASGKKAFSHRIIISTTNNWTEHAEDALRDQQPPVSKIDLFDLENSQIDWAQFHPKQAPVLKAKKQLREHQESALAAVRAGLRDNERGKLIMACGTGKTFTSLKIAETVAGVGKRVLFLVPSLSLLSQSLSEWTQEASLPLDCFAVCSDSDVGKKRKKDDDVVQTFTHELRYPASTNASALANAMHKRFDATRMTVVFSTYHSIGVINAAQTQFEMADFDLIICDEAHRTTGQTDAGDDESTFIRVHDGAFIRSEKRLYMTATPRIYGEMAKATAEKDSITLCSMDDAALYGKLFYTINFSEAVARGLLVDYKVIVLAVEESHVNRRIQKLLADSSNQMKLDDASKIIGCWKALAKQGLSADLSGDNTPMQRAVAFCQVIERSVGGKTHKVSSKHIASMFQAVVEAYQESELDEELAAVELVCEAEHVDGGMNATAKEAKLSWLKSEAAANTCRILSNVRCLSEGVDVPALDAVLFLTPRNSQIDVVQSVGRVMRNAPGKKRGYVVLPIVIPAGIEPHDALADNQTYKVVWQVLQALRSHDDRFDAMVNKMELVGPDRSKMEVIAVTDSVKPKAMGMKTPRGKKATTNSEAGSGDFTVGSPGDKPVTKPEQGKLQFQIGELEKAVYAKVVQKVGNRSHWEDWANDIAKIARTHIERISGILANPENVTEIKAFHAFAAELRDDLNDSISDSDIVEMLAQHLITKPVFDALFANYSFTQHNPMSLAMQAVLDVLQAHRLDKETDTLQRFYDSVKLRASGIDNAAGKQKIVVELYDKFFRNAFPKMTERLGIVYTPVEVVDFIIHSVEHILKTEFGESLGSKGVHIIDPFTGTGTFITRLMQSGLISPEQLKHKYRHEIHANEIVLLAYYIAAINIEATYHDIVGGNYVPFEGICLTDTFQMYEKEDLVDALLVQNSSRRKKQKALDIRVIIGNPPYSAGQDSANDDAANIEYSELDRRISETYIAGSEGKGGKRSAYDSYIRALRWASDRIEDSGVIGFVSGSGFIEKPAFDGLRKCLQSEFTRIYIFNLRGDIRKNILSKGKASEGENIFENGSMTGIAITILVKNKGFNRVAEIFYHDIGNSLDRESKLKILRDTKSVQGLHELWDKIYPNIHQDWIKQRVIGFNVFPVLGSKRLTKDLTIFESFSNGVVSNRDAWVYGSSKSKLAEKFGSMVAFYNSEIDRYERYLASPGHSKLDAQAFVSKELTRISWGGGNWQSNFAKLKHEQYDPATVRVGMYRPFSKQWHIGARNFNHSFYSMPIIFPSSEVLNYAICISGVGARSGFACLIVNMLPNLHTLDTGQCFPLYLYETAEPEAADAKPDLFTAQTATPSAPVRRDAITDVGLAHFQSAYPDTKISKEDLFYYIYGLLHSPDYRARYADNLSKELPRIPRVKTADDFWAFSKAGRALAELHLHYESVPMYPCEVSGVAFDASEKSKLDLSKLPAADYRVEKMRYGKNGKDKDLSTVHYNHKITVSGIPLAAYEYVVNGKPAIDWVLERQCVKTDKDSGIVNDANDWAVETMHNPRYPLELLLRVVTVSLETMKVVNALPGLDILGAGEQKMIGASESAKYIT